MNNQNISGNTKSKGYGVTALILGIISVIAFPILIWVPIMGLVISSLAFILGVTSLNTPTKISAIIGMILGLLAGVYWLYLILSALISMSS